MGHRCDPSGLLRARRSRTGQVGHHFFFKGRVTSRTRRGGCAHRSFHLAVGPQTNIRLPFRRAARVWVSKVPLEARVSVVVGGRSEWMAIFISPSNLRNSEWIASIVVRHAGDMPSYSYIRELAKNGGNINELSCGRCIGDWSVKAKASEVMCLSALCRFCATSKTLPPAQY